MADLLYVVGQRILLYLFEIKKNQTKFRKTLAFIIKDMNMLN